MPKAGDNHIQGNFKGKDILSIDQFQRKDVEKVLTTAKKMEQLVKSKGGSDLLKGKVEAALFYEPSSRTFGSFITAIQRLGGGFIPLQGMSNSSVSKGETLEDTIHTFSSFSDVIVMRHPEVGSVKIAAGVTDLPVINAGDGKGEHPTQALLDAYTIYQTVGRLDNLTILFAGDILNGRTIHSLLRTLALFKGNTAYLLSPKELRLTREEYEDFSNRGVKLVEIEDEKDIPKDADIWYWTRVQKERFANLKDYEKVKNKFILDKELVERYAGKKTYFMHPLPRVGEITTDVDEDPRALYFRVEMKNGMYVRMALLALVLGKA